MDLKPAAAAAAAAAAYGDQISTYGGYYPARLAAQKPHWA
jgi:hypothetical protein